MLQFREIKLQRITTVEITFRVIVVHKLVMVYTITTHGYSRY